MNLLYLTEDYLYSKVHNNLLSHILEKDESLNVYVFSPLRKDEPISDALVGSFYHNKRLIIITPMIEMPICLYRYDYWAKMRYKVKLIEKHVNINTIDAIHAATLFSEGGVAFRLYKKYHIPYFVSIRGTDVGLYSNKMPHLWLSGVKVMKHANVLSCVTPTIKKTMLSKWQYYSCRERIKNAEIITNGIDDIWINNIFRDIKELGSPIRVLYIGRFDINKNVLRLISSIKILRNKYNIRLTMIGGGGDEHEEVIKLVSENPDYLEYLGRIYEKEELIKIARACDIFAMVSHGETFGLVYIECLTQGLPLLFTKNTGIDGLFPEGTVGYGVDSFSVESIVNGLTRVINNFKELRTSISKLSYDNFNWDKLASTYLRFYKPVMREKGGGYLKKLYYFLLAIKRIPYDIIRHNHINRTNKISSSAMLIKCHLGSYNYVAEKTSLYNTTIGSYCSIGPGCDMGGMEHPYNNVSTSGLLCPNPIEVKKTIIEDDVWVGAQSYIKAGVKIGRGAVIGAQSFVNKDVPPYAIVFGSPARLYKYRFDKEKIATIMQTEYWKQKPEEARCLIESL